MIASEKVPAPTVDDLVAETRQTYGGPLQVGEDLMQFEIGDHVTVRQLDASAARFGNAAVPKSP
jgi:ribonuclease Z